MCVRFETSTIALQREWLPKSSADFLHKKEKKWRWCRGRRGGDVSLSLISLLATFKSLHCWIHILCLVTLFALIPISLGRCSRPAPIRLRQTGFGWTCLLTLSQNPLYCSASDAPRSRVGNIKQEGATNSLITCGKNLDLTYSEEQRTSCCFQPVSVATVCRAAGAPGLTCAMKHALTIIFNNKT